MTLFKFTRIGYVYVPTTRIDESIEWYTKYLDFKLMNKFRDRGSYMAALHHPHMHSIALVLIETEDVNRMVISRNGSPFPIMAVNCPNIENTYEALKQNGIDVDDIQTLGNGVAKYFYLRDNEGHLLEAAWSIWDIQDDIKDNF